MTLNDIGDEVVAVFPDTTSFYRAVVAKTPKPPLPCTLFIAILFVLLNLTFAYFICS